MLRYFTETIYVQVSPEKVTVRNAKTGSSFSEVPEVALSDASKPQIIAIGKQARSVAASQSLNAVNPFAHPRTMVSDFFIGELTLKVFIANVRSHQWFRPLPNVVLHLLGEPEGGFTQVEVRAFQEMGMGSGASKVIVWQGTELTNEALLSGVFPSSGKVLS